MRRPAQHVEFVRCEGYAQAIHVGLILENRDKIVAACGRIALFDDLEETTGYDSAVRVKLTDWANKNRPKIVAHHILTSARIVAMGVTVANLALGGHIVAHTRRRAFEDALAKEVGRRL